MCQNNFILSCDHLFGIIFQQYTVSIFPFPYFDICNANLHSGKLYWFQNKSSSKWNLSNNCWLDWQWRNSLKIYVMSRWLWFTISHSRWVLLQSVTVTLSHQWLVNKNGFSNWSSWIFSWYDWDDVTFWYIGTPRFAFNILGTDWTEIHACSTIFKQSNPQRRKTWNGLIFETYLPSL